MILQRHPQTPVKGRVARHSDTTPVRGARTSDEPYAILARRAGKDERESELLRLASKMHDIGKLGIPDAILLKPGKLPQPSTQS